MVHEIEISRPHDNQKKIIESPAKRKVIMAGRQFGKSWLSKHIAMERMLKGQFVLYITPTFDLAKVMMADLIKLFPDSLVKSKNKTDREIVLVTGGRIKFYSGENLDRIRGNTDVSLIIVDEASIIPELQTHWGTAVLPVLLRKNGDVVLISTPSGREWFYNQFMKGINGEPGYESFQFSSFDSPTLDSKVIAELMSEMTEAQINQEIYAIAGANESSAFGANIEKNIIGEYSKNPTISFGIDVASGHGTDWSCIIGLDMYGHMTYCDRFKLDWPTTLDRISKLPQNINKIIDATGAGDVAYEILRQTMRNLHPFVFTATSKPELMRKLIKDVESGNVKYTQPVADEMSVFEYKRTPSGHYTYNAKSGGFNDDMVCALALSNHHRAKAAQESKWKVYTKPRR